MQGRQVGRGSTPGRASGGQAFLRWCARPWMLQAAPAIVIATYGALWIATQASAGRGSAHTLWQSLALSENMLALLMRHRKPVGALAGILAVYLITDVEPVTLLPLLLALLTVAMISNLRKVISSVAATATAVVAMPYIHGDVGSIAGHTLPRLAAVGLAAAAGTYLRRFTKPHPPNPPSPPSAHRRHQWQRSWLGVEGSAARRRPQPAPGETPLPRPGTAPDRRRRCARHAAPDQRSDPRPPECRAARPELTRPTTAPGSCPATCSSSPACARDPSCVTSPSDSESCHDRPPRRSAKLSAALIIWTGYGRTFAPAGPAIRKALWHARLKA